MEQKPNQTDVTIDWLYQCSITRTKNPFVKKIKTQFSEDEECFSLFGSSVLTHMIMRSVCSSETRGKCCWVQNTYCEDTTLCYRITSESETFSLAVLHKRENAQEYDGGKGDYRYLLMRFRAVVYKPRFYLKYGFQICLFCVLFFINNNNNKPL